MIGLPTTVIEALGSTSLIEVGNNFFLYQHQQRVRPRAEICWRGGCGGPVRRLDADRRGADRDRL